MIWLWLWLWLGLAAATGIVALYLVACVLDVLSGRASARNAAIRQRQYDAETAMVRTVQETIAEMFDTVRRQR